MVDLATTVDVQNALGRALTSEEQSKVAFILQLASEKFRREAGQIFTPGNSVVRLKVDGGKVYLPERPVTSVTSVVDDEGDPVTYTRAGQWLTVDLGSDAFVTVSYAHGAATPDIVRLTVADVAKRVLTISADAAQGATQASSTTGPFTESRTFAAWAVGGQIMLSPDDVAVARRFRFKPPHMTVMRP